MGSGWSQITKPAFVLTFKTVRYPWLRVISKSSLDTMASCWLVTLWLFWQVFGGGDMLYARWALGIDVNSFLQYTSPTEMTVERVEGVYGILTGVSIRDKWL
jgi:hypothetical protein